MQLPCCSSAPCILQHLAPLLSVPFLSFLLLVGLCRPLCSAVSGSHSSDLFLVAEILRFAVWMLKKLSQSEHTTESWNNGTRSNGIALCRYLYVGKGTLGRIIELEKVVAWDSSQKECCLPSLPRSRAEGSGMCEEGVRGMWEHLPRQEGQGSSMWKCAAH